MKYKKLGWCQGQKKRLNVDLDDGPGKDVFKFGREECFPLFISCADVVNEKTEWSIAKQSTKTAKGQKSNESKKKAVFGF